ncbi:hypothetical protein [Weissella cibaria]|uniref:Uncharacterized protein n=1 Tax=Weissella cibaria TaxID=137591 RepID=A0A2S1KQ73_9LACO|nr:hypothetical protein [Weissella cibaria]AWF95124.1 hypothetical protein B6254_0714 [Weissella cibaria]
MEFEFKIIDVEKGTHSLTSENGDKWDVDNLPDALNILESAPKKHVIELPADVIEGIQNAKTYWENVAGFVLNAPSIVFPEIRKSIGEPKASYDKVADILGSWYFGNIEFVAKKEPKFVVFVEFGFKTNLVEVVNFKKTGKRVIKFLEMSDWEALVEEALKYGEVGDLPTMTEIEADKLIAGLGGENELLKPRKVKVEE